MPRATAKLANITVYARFLGVAKGSEPAHFAFLVSDAEFDEILDRIREQGRDYWADPEQRQVGQINRHDGGRGLYFEDSNGHLMEIFTRPFSRG